MADYIIDFDTDLALGITTNDSVCESLLEHFREKSFVDCSGCSELEKIHLFNSGFAHDGRAGFVCVKCHSFVTSTNTVSPPDARQEHIKHYGHCPYVKSRQNSRINGPVITQRNAQSHENRTNSLFSPTGEPVLIDISRNSKNRSPTPLAPANSLNLQANRNQINWRHNELQPHSIDHYIQNPASNERFTVSHPSSIASIIDAKMRSPWFQAHLANGCKPEVLKRFIEIQVKCYELIEYESDEELKFLATVMEISRNHCSKIALAIEAVDSATGWSNVNTEIDALILLNPDDLTQSHSSLEMRSIIDSALLSTFYLSYTTRPPD